ncbi:MAG: MFS transporter [Propionibacteriaceae bacterium]|nr:MFS transporter [Propionibacteriaceae bacterium]
MSTTADGESKLALTKTEKVPKSKVISWALWDWGTQPWATVITTFVFAVYITTPEFFSADRANSNGPTLALSVSTMIVGVIIAVIAPVLGQSADRSGHLIRNLRWLTWVLGVAALALFFVAPHPSYLILGLVILGGGSIVNEIAGSFYNASIDQVADENNVGKVSGFGWGMGYLGGIVVLIIILVIFILPEVGLFGITDTPMKIRASMVVCGIWMLTFTIPPLLTLKDRPAQVASPKMGVAGSYRALGRSIVHLWKNDRHVAYFLLASALFRDGLAAVFTFGAVIAAQSFGFTTTEIILFGAAANLVAGIVTIVFGLLDDKIGPKKVILFCLGILSVGAIIVFALHDQAYTLPAEFCNSFSGYCQENPAYSEAKAAQGKLIFWVFGLILSCLVGPTQAASRSFLARVIPEGKSGEIFGLYTTTGRAVSFISPALFGLFVYLGAQVSGINATQHWGLLAIAVVLAAGFFVLLPVHQPSAVSQAPPVTKE